MHDVVLTIVGSDRPGLVEAVAEVVARAGGNWLESRMVHLAGKFAGVLRVQAPAEAIPRVVAAIEALAHADLKVTVEPGVVGATPGSQRSLDLDLVGLDRAGIVRDISASWRDTAPTSRSSSPMCRARPCLASRYSALTCD